MTTLIFLEAFPLRNRLTGHLWLTGEFRHLLQSSRDGSADIKIFCSSLAAERLVEQDESVAPFIIPFNDSLESLYFSRLDVWTASEKADDHTGISRWLNYASGLDTEISDRLYESLSSIKRSIYDFDTLLYWGANGALANSRLKEVLPSVVSISMELGPTRLPFEPTIYFDPFGVNGESSISRLNADQVLGLAQALPTRLQLENMVSVPKLKQTLFQSRPGRLSDGLGRRLQNLRPAHGRLILFAHQLADDVNSLLYSEGWDTCSALDAVMNHDATQSDLVLVKRHPKATNNQFNYRGWKKVLHHIENSYPDRVHIWEDIVPAEETIAFLEFFDVCIGINSSVLFESALLGKPVGLFGKSGYFPSGSEHWWSSTLGDTQSNFSAREAAVGINIKYLLPHRSILRSMQSLTELAKSTSECFSPDPLDFIKKYVTHLRRNFPHRDELSMSLPLNTSFRPRQVLSRPPAGKPVPVDLTSTGFTHTSLVAKYETANTPDVPVAVLEAFDISGDTLTLKLRAVTDFGVAADSFAIISGGKAAFFPPTERRPALARAQGISDKLKVAATVELPLDPEASFLLYCSFEIWAVMRNGNAVPVKVSRALRESLRAAILSRAEMQDV